MRRSSRGAARGGWKGAEEPVKNETVRVPVTAPQESMDEDESVMEMQVENGEENKVKKIWRGPADGKIRKRVKKTAGQKNLRLRKFVQPKNAVLCLNELRPGLVYSVEQSIAGCGTPIFVTVEVDGQIYRGFGSTKQLAKQAAAEAALISFVKPPPAPSATGEAPKEDATPWAVLACFAMYKLFNEWKEGRVGTMPPMMTSPEIMQGSNLTQTLQALLGRQMQNAAPMEGVVPEVNFSHNNALSAYLGKSHEILDNGKSETEVPKVACKPAKQVPENAHLLHPVMLLHQMRPAVLFKQSSVVKDGKNVYVMSATIDDLIFTGEATNVKKAKFELAVKANSALFSIETAFVPAK